LKKQKSTAPPSQKVLDENGTHFPHTKSENIDYFQKISVQQKVTVFQTTVGS